MNMKFFKKKWGKIVAGVLILAVVFFIGKGWNGDEYFSLQSGGYDDWYDWDYEEEYEMAASKSASDISYDYYYDEPVPNTSGVDLNEIDFTDAMVIKNAYLDITVDDTLESVSYLEDIAKSYNGYVSYSYTYENYDGSMSGTVTFRVPADQFDSAMTDVRGMADVITSESIDAQDVTEEYLDLDARLGTLYELEEQYMVVLDSAVTVEEILLVYDYLQGVREEIESVEGSMQYYENQASYSTITVYLEEVVSVFVEAGKWRPVEVAREAFQGWLGVLQDGANAVIWIVVYLWILPVLWLVWRLFRRRS